MTSTEKFASFNWIRGVLDDKRISIIHRAILIRLVVHRQKDGRCDPGYDAVAKELGVNRKTVLGAVDAGVLTGWLAPPVRGRRANANFIFTFGQEVPPDGTSRTDQEVPPGGTSRTDQEVRPGELRSTAFCVKKSAQKEASEATSKTSTGHGHLTGKENGQQQRGAQGEGVVEGRKHPHGRLLAQLLQAAAGNVERNEWGIAYGIDQVEPIRMLIENDRCSLEADILPVITELVPTLTEPLHSWHDRRILDACLARRRTREAEARAKENAR